MSFDRMQDVGLQVAALVDQEAHKVSARVFQDPDVYQTELDNLFARSWIVVGHESELSAAGDYVSRYIGEDPVIVVRARDGQINVLLNVCAHKAAMVCRAELGNSSTFKCPYHGWLYGDDGSLLAMVAEREMYGDDFDKSPYGLTRARVGTYAGLVFATFDERAPSLEEFLGDYRFYLDILFARSKNGMEVAGPPQRWVIPSNWKCAAEQFATDGYHALTLHRSMVDIGLFGGPEPDYRTQGLYGIDVTMPQGHTLRCTESSFDTSGAKYADRRYRGMVPAGRHVTGHGGGAREQVDRRATARARPLRAERRGGLPEPGLAEPLHPKSGWTAVGDRHDSTLESSRA
jgi:nitrite reductase/ring-hydroxylating ferredoxin subunit